MPTAYFRGPRVSGPGDLAPYVGVEAHERVVGELRRQACRANHEQLRANYHGAVEFQLRDRLVLICPQTVDCLYSTSTPATVRYRRGSRPELERIVGRLVDGGGSRRETALGLMRFCRDLYTVNWPVDARAYVYGGTEEELVRKGEWTCECLSRLYVALCEVAGIAARILMHLVGGHIAAEALLEEGWAYIDPRCGLYFERPDGRLASARDLIADPGLLRRQRPEVAADVSPQWSWAWRVWKCEHQFFDPREVSGLVNYSLEDAPRYDFSQTSAEQAARDGLWTINARYRKLIGRVFGLEGDLDRLSWKAARPRKTTLVYRNDGFSPFFRHVPPMTKDELLRRFVDPLAGTNVSILEWGLGPGSVFCFATKAGQIFGEPLTEAQWRLMREGDRRVHENVMGLVRSGVDPLSAVVERAHRIGLEVYARLEMNHEYGPASDENWLWVGFVGELNKKHPEYRIPGTVHLDFSQPEVRLFKLAILREAAETGVDGVSMDFLVYPPHFARPDRALMSGFVGEVRSMLDSVGARSRRRLGLMVRVPFDDAAELGLDWKSWMQEGLVDIVVPDVVDHARFFDIDIGEFISVRNRTGARVFGCSWQALGFVTTDAFPEDEQKGRKHDKPKTREMFHAQASLLHRAGVDGIQLAMAADEWNDKQWLDDLADPERLRRADKHLMVDCDRQMPLVFPAGGGSTRSVRFRLADDVRAAHRERAIADASVIYYARNLAPGETLALRVNGGEPIVLQGSAAGGAEDPPRFGEGGARVATSTLLDAEWWRRGEHAVRIDPGRLRMGTNSIRLTHSVSAEPPAGAPDLVVPWVDVVVRYRKA